MEFLAKNCENKVFYLTYYYILLAVYFPLLLLIQYNYKNVST